MVIDIDQILVSLDETRAPRKEISVIIYIGVWLILSVTTVKIRHIKEDKKKKWSDVFTLRLPYDILVPSHKNIRYAYRNNPSLFYTFHFSSALFYAAIFKVLLREDSPPVNRSSTFLLLMFYIFLISTAPLYHLLKEKTINSLPPTDLPRTIQIYATDIYQDFEKPYIRLVLTFLAQVILYFCYAPSV